VRLYALWIGDEECEECQAPLLFRGGFDRTSQEWVDNILCGGLGGSSLVASSRVRIRFKHSERESNAAAPVWCKEQ
jgi:hypothetical protein